MSVFGEPRGVNRGPVLWAVGKAEAARGLSVSPDFFEDWIAPEIKSVQRGRRRLYPVKEIERWLEQEARSERRSSPRHRAGELRPVELGESA